MKIIGISAFYHDSAAALVIDGNIISAAQEERFTRKKHDPSFPSNSIKFILEDNNLCLTDIDYVVFYDKPLVKFERILETYLSYAPRGLRSFLMAMPIWLKEKLFLKETLKRELSALSGLSKKHLPQLMFTEHHQSHAASAFYPSPYEKSAVLCIDGVGEWATTSVWLGDGNKLTPLWEIDFPHSLGLLYSAFTYYTGFKVNSGEYKLMGLAPYGTAKYVDLIYEELIIVKPDGSFSLNMDYFNYATGLTMTNSKFSKLFGGPPRTSESEITQKEMDMARSIQVVTEEVVLKIAKSIKKELDVDYLCLAGGVALNCVSNGRLHKEKIFKDIWIQPAAGDAGGAIGSALSIWHDYLNNDRKPLGKSDNSEGSYLGPNFTDKEIIDYLDSTSAKYRLFSPNELAPKVAEYIANENVIGWFQGKMEFGPRALGARSILGDPRSKKMQQTMNLKIKYRESFRPFAPSVKAENVSEWFDFDGVSPYMLMVSEIHNDKKILMTEEQSKLFGVDKLNVVRSVIPAVTHVDYTARIQTVHKETNPRYWELLDSFEKITGCPIVINTSFNVRGEPIVCSPEDAYRCFMRTEMDYLVIGNIILSKSEQPSLPKDSSWQDEFTLD
jgi:carbamoyltransferase